VITAVALTPLIAARLWWQCRRTTCAAAVFAGVLVLYMLPLLLVAGPSFVSLGWVGAAMNMAVILRNRGRMPVVGMTEPGLHSAWVRARRDRHRWLLLADRRALWWSSPGDLVIVLSLVLAFLNRGVA
jgi:hypothetical protein